MDGGGDIGGDMGDMGDRERTTDLPWLALPYAGGLGTFDPGTCNTTTTTTTTTTTHGSRTPTPRKTTSSTRTRTGDVFVHLEALETPTDLDGPSSWDTPSTAQGDDAGNRARGPRNGGGSQRVPGGQREDNNAALFSIDDHPRDRDPRAIANPNPNPNSNPNLNPNSNSNPNLTLHSNPHPTATDRDRDRGGNDGGADRVIHAATTIRTPGHRRRHGPRPKPRLKVQRPPGGSPTTKNGQMEESDDEPGDDGRGEDEDDDHGGKRSTTGYAEAEAGEEGEEEDEDEEEEDFTFTFIPWHTLHFSHLLGKGAYGEVWAAYWDTAGVKGEGGEMRPVAVKTLRHSPDAGPVAMGMAAGVVSGHPELEYYVRDAHDRPCCPAPSPGLFNPGHPGHPDHPGHRPPNPDSRPVDAIDFDVEVGHIVPKPVPVPVPVSLSTPVPPSPSPPSPSSPPIPVVVLPAPSPESLACRRSIETELHLLTQLSHPRIVSCYGGGLEPHPFVVMAWLKRGSLETWITQMMTATITTNNPSESPGRRPRPRPRPLPFRPRLSYRSTLGLAIDVAGALAYLHPSGVVHRDLKPANILIGDDGHATIADFGISRLRDPDHSTRFQLTRNDGTPLYMAPEVLQSRIITDKCDIYSLGIVLIEMYSGIPAWRDLRDPIQVVFQVCVAGKRPDIPAETPAPLRRLLSRMVHENPLERPSAADVLLEASRLLDAEERARKARGKKGIWY